MDSFVVPVLFLILMLVGLLGASMLNVNKSLKVNGRLGNQIEKLTTGVSLWQSSFGLYLKRQRAQDELDSSRWQVIVATTPSGKTQFVCTCCGRVSQTPDITCVKGAEVQIGGETRNIPCTEEERWQAH